MPIPILVWVAVAAGGALTAWHFRKEIAEFFDSPAGQRLLHDIGEAAKGAMEPYRNMIDEAYPMNSTKRREFFRQAKARMGRTDWVAFVGYCKGLTQTDLRYMAAWMDLAHVDQEEQ